MRRRAEDGRRRVAVGRGLLMAATLGLGSAGCAPAEGIAAPPMTPADAPGASAASASTTPDPRQTGSTPASGLRVIIVGDSNTQVDSPDFSRGRIGASSWAHTVVNASGIVFAGGWALGGSTSGAQAAALAPSEGDVLLVMTGTNDLARGVPFAEIAANIEAIVAKVSAPRVVLLAIPPRDGETTPPSTEFNVALEALARQHGWEFFDGMGFLRDPVGGFVDGTTTDGLHLSPSAQAEFGRAVVAYLVG